MTAVLFDMDGVVVNSEDFWVDFQREEILPAAVPDADVAVAETSGMNFREIYDYLEAEYGTAISREEFIRRFNAAAEEIDTERARLLDGLPELLAELDARGVPTAIVSSSPHNWIDMVLEQFAALNSDLIDGYHGLEGRTEEIDSGYGSRSPRLR